MTEELEVLKIVTGRLESAGMAYMVTGSMAMSYYAVPRMTRDIDVAVKLEAADAERVCALFEGDFYVDRDAARGVFNLIHQAYVVKVDFIVRKESDYRRAELARRHRASVEGHGFFIVAPEDLIISKLDWARDTRLEVQLGDARNLLMSVPGPRPRLPCALERAPRARDSLPRGSAMRDTSPEMAARYRAMLLARSPEERLRIGCSMHATARELVRASVLAQNPQASPAAQRRALFLRFYRHEFAADKREGIMAWLGRGHKAAEGTAASSRELGRLRDGADLERRRVDVLPRCAERRGPDG